MDRVKIRYAVDIGLIISFLIVFITGIIKLRILSPYFSGFIEAVTPKNMALVHDWSGIVMGFLVFVHIALNWSCLVAMTKKYFGNKSLKKKRKVNIKSRNL